MHTPRDTQLTPIEVFLLGQLSELWANKQEDTVVCMPPIRASFPCQLGTALMKVNVSKYKSKVWVSIQEQIFLEGSTYNIILFLFCLSGDDDMKEY